MSQLLSRILLTILLFPSATLVLFVAFIFLERTVWRSDGDAFTAASLLTCAYMIAYWLALWRRSVVWTDRRKTMTAMCGVAAGSVGAVVGISMGMLQSYNHWLGWMFGSLTAAVLWIIGTICIWRETVAERAARISRAGVDTLVCPNCGYNLTGLSEARCPECGSRFTIDELLASQPNRAASAAEIER
jgi:hypothetical protein